MIVWCEACASEHRRLWQSSLRLSISPFALQPTFPKLFETSWNIYIFRIFKFFEFLRRKNFFSSFLFYTYIYISLLKNLKSPFKCRCPPDRRGAQLWWRSPTSCIQVENFSETIDQGSHSSPFLSFPFFFSFSRKDYIPEEHENADQNSCRRGQTDRREDVHGKFLDLWKAFFFFFEFFKNAFLLGPKNVGFRKLCHPTEAWMGEDRIHVAPLRAEFGVWITSGEKHDPISRHCRASRNAQAFPLQIQRWPGRKVLKKLLLSLLLLFLRLERKFSLKFSLLKPSYERQIEALTSTVAEIIWRSAGGFAVQNIGCSSGQSAAGNKSAPTAVVVLPQETPYVQHSVQYFQDGLTETVRIYKYT